MGFQAATLQFSVNGDAAVAEWRQDLEIDDVVTVSLTDNVGANSYRWRLIGRPEGSAAGGPGPEPRYLGTAQVASFTVDVLGTYIVQCLVNAGAPDALAIGGGVAILENFLAPGNRALRLLGPGESNEDVSDPMVVQGWIKMLNRWLTKIRAGGGTTDTFKVMADLYDDDPDYLIGKVESTDGSVVITDDVAGKRVDFAVFTKPTPKLTKRYYLTSQISDRLRGVYNGHLLSMTNPSDEAHAVDLTPPGASQFLSWFDSPVAEPGLVTWPSGIVNAHIRVRVLNTHVGLTYKLYPGDHSIVYESILGREGVVYNVEPFADAPTISASYQTVDIPLYTHEMTGPSSDRLLADFILQVTGGSLTNEVLELRCGGDNASYIDTLFTPAGDPVGVSDHKVSVDSGDTADYLFAKLSAGTNVTLAKAGAPTSETVEISVVGGGTSNGVESTDDSITVTDAGGGVQDIVLPNSTAIPTTCGGAGSAGVAGPKSNETHQHPASPVVSLTKRYYLTGLESDLIREPGYSIYGYLFSTTNPSDEAHALDIGVPPSSSSSQYIWFDTPLGEPGLGSWPSGIVMANLRLRVRNTHPGMTYTLYPGGDSIAYESMLIDLGTRDFYEVAPYPAAPILTSSYQTFLFPLYATGLTGSSARRLRGDLILQFSGGSLTDEVFEVRCGGDDASYFDTLFTPSSGGPTVHNDLTGRGTFLDPANAPLLGHPMSFVEPGVVHSPCGAVITTAAGLFTMPNSNTAHIDGAEDLLGIADATAGGTAYQVGDCITVWIAQARVVQGDGFSVGDPTRVGYSPIYLPPAAFVDPTNPAAGPQIQAASDNFIDLVFSGTKWMHKSSSLG